MAAKDKPDKHHYVPKCYLNKFCDEHREVYRLNLDDYLYIRKVSPTSICYESAFYSIDANLKHVFRELAGRDEFEVESEILAKTESDYNGWHASIIESGKLTIKECRSFTEFLVTLKTRNRYWRERVIPHNIRTHIDRISEELLQESRRHSVFSKYPEKMVKLALKLSAEVYKTNPLASKFFQINRLISYQDPQFQTKVVDVIMDSVWILVINETNIPFVTTDNPGFSYNMITGDVGTVGFNTNYLFMISLSPRHVLKLDCTKKENNRSGYKIIYTENVANGNIIESINLQLIHVAHEIIVSNDKDSINHYKHVIARHRLLYGMPQLES